VSYELCEYDGCGGCFLSNAKLFLKLNFACFIHRGAVPLSRLWTWSRTALALLTPFTTVLSLRYPRGRRGKESFTTRSGRLRKKERLQTKNGKNKVFGLNIKRKNGKRESKNSPFLFTLLSKDESPRKREAEERGGGSSGFGQKSMIAPRSCIKIQREEASGDSK
jgi:hypothetical protein